MQAPTKTIDDSVETPYRRWPSNVFLQTILTDDMIKACVDSVTFISRCECQSRVSSRPISYGHRLSVGTSIGHEMRRLTKSVTYLH